MSEKIEASAERDEPFGYCEACSKALYDGDKHHLGSDVYLCANCAPDFADLLANPDSFVGSEGEPITAEAAHEIYHAHIAAGGLPGDKFGLRS